MEHICPLFMIGYYAGDGEPLSPWAPVSDIECIGERCQLWDEENEVCSIKSISRELNGLREQLSELVEVVKQCKA